MDRVLRMYIQLTMDFPSMLSIDENHHVILELQTNSHSESPSYILTCYVLDLDYSAMLQLFCLSVVSSQEPATYTHPCEESARVLGRTMSFHVRVMEQHRPRSVE